MESDVSTCRRGGHLSVLVAATVASWLAVVAPVVRASEIVEVLPLTEEIVMLHFDDGHVIHHRRGEPRGKERAVVSPLDTRAASAPARYTIRSTDDPAYAKPRHPLAVGRKSKGTEFAWRCDWRQREKRCVNAQPDHAKEHWIYLTLPAPFVRGKTYTIGTGTLASNGGLWTLAFDEVKARSEAVHVNLLGYAPAAPEKFAYVYHWMGDRGGLSLKRDENRACRLVDRRSSVVAFTTPLVFRHGAGNAETGHTADTPRANFLGAEVHECDFSAFDRPGEYVVAVDGVGRSFPFRIADDVYRAAFRATARSLYHNRSGIALTQPYTSFTRPAPHNPRLTPGFAGKLIYTTVRFTEWGSESGNAAALLAGAKGPLDVSGWYQDAGDWDSYPSHLRVAQELLIVHQLAPRNFADGELNIPESGNGIPDIVDEAAWLPRFLYRLRHELLAKRYGTGGVGLRIAGDAFGGDERTLPDGTRVGQGSWEDVSRTWAVSGEDPWSTYGYAGVAAQLAHALALLGKKDPQGVDWAREAAEAYAWARANTRTGDEQPKSPPLRAQRLFAAAALYQATGEARYEAQVIADTRSVTPTTVLDQDVRYGAFLHALSGGAGRGARDEGAWRRVRAAVLATADEVAVVTPARRALRWAGNFWTPMVTGQQTTPWVLEGAVAHALVRGTEPARARRYLAALYTTADYFLGTNALNMTWVTGLGPRSPQQVFHLDAWYNGKPTPHPGIVPYGIWKKDKDVADGPWDHAWPHATVYPGIDAWPGNERWFSNRCAPMTGEFTIHQNAAPAAAIYGFLSGSLAR